MKVGEERFAMPDFPQKGTLFVFFPLEGEAMFGVEFAKVLYTEADVFCLPERGRPAGTSSPWEEINNDYDFLILERCEDGGRVLQRQFVEVLPYMSARGENPLWRNMEREDPSRDLSQRDDAHVLFETSLERVLSQDHSKSKLKERRNQRGDTYANRIPEDMLQYVQVSDDEITWAFIFDWAQHFYLYILSKLQDGLEEQLKDGDLHPDLPELISLFEGFYKQVEETPYTPIERPFTEYLFSMPRRRSPPDDQAKKWMGMAKTANGPVPGFVKRRIVDTWCEIYSSAQRDEPARLKLFEAFAGHTYRAQFIYEASRSAYIRAKRRGRERIDAEHARADAAKTPEQLANEQVIRETTFIPTPEYGNNYGGQIVPIQMFGAGYLLQNAAVQYADKVLLFQHCGGFGTPINFSDLGTLQIWIDPEDLAAGRFDKTITTYEMT